MPLLSTSLSPSFEFWGHSIEALQTGKAHNEAVVLTFLVGNVALTFLQFYWGVQLVGFARATFGGGGAGGGSSKGGSKAGGKGEKAS